MKTKHAYLLAAIALGSLFLASCATGLIPTSWTGITTDAETAYIATGQFVYAVRLEDGQELWSFPEKGSAAKTYFAAPALTQDGQLIVGGYDKILYSLNPESGAINWQFEGATDRWIGSVLAVNDMIYAPSADYTLYALDMDGVLQWDFRAGQSLWSKPAYYGGQVFIGSLDHKVYALEARSGEEAWPQPSELDGAILSDLVIDPDGKLYVSTFGGSVYALDPDTGEVIWKFTGDNPFWASPVLAEDTLLIGDYGGNFYAIDPDTGQENLLVQANGAIFSTPLVIGRQAVFCTDAGFVYFVNLDDGEFESHSFPGSFYNSPVAAGNLILVAPQESESLLIALNMEGSQTWAFEIEE